MPTENASKNDLMSILSKIPDYRINRTRFHKLEDIMAIAMCATICGADSFVDFARFGRAKEAWLSTFLELPHGIPSHDTFRRVFTLLAPEHFLEAFIMWTAGVRKLLTGEVVAIDGKALRAALDAGGKIPVILGAYAAESGLALGQLKVDEKSNEITAVPELLDLLVLKGCIVTLDAMGCQKEIARKICEGEADYILALKGNQGSAFDQTKSYLDAAAEGGWEWVSYSEEGPVKSHGRHERRRCWQSGELGWFEGRESWEGLESVILVESERGKPDGTVSVERRYFLSSLEPDAARALHAVRAHWGIENSLHWVLDMGFNEDWSRARSGNADENLSTMRRWSINAIKTEKAHGKESVVGRRKIAGWDDSYLAKVFTTKLDA